MDTRIIAQFLKQASEIMKEHKEELIAMDSIFGDGDLGLTMSDGFTAAYEAIKDDDTVDIGTQLYQAGKAMSIAVPSTMGTLMASGLMSAGKALKGEMDFSVQDAEKLFASYEAGVAKRGKAQVGEKTFLDGLHPAVLSLQQSVSQGDSLTIAAEKAVSCAQQGYDDTKEMLAVHGRAAIRGEESKTVKDPGAYVAVLIMEAFSEAVKTSSSN